MLLRLFHASSQSERMLWLRLANLWMLSAAMIWFLQSGITDDVFRNTLVERTAPITWSYALPFMFFLFLGIIVRQDVQSYPQLALPSFLQTVTAILSASFLFLLSLRLLHPSTAQFAALQAFGERHPAIGDPLLSALIGSFLFLPVLVLPLIVLPWSLFLHHRTGTIVSLLSIVGFLLFPALEAAYFHITGPPLVSAVRRVIALFPGSIPSDLHRLQIGYEQFSVTVGYACTEFSSVIFLIGLLGMAFRSLYRKKSLSPWRAAVVLLLGIVLLWILNVLRIAAIVVIGAYHPAFALTLFHSGIGLILFLLFFIVYTKLSLPFVREKEKL